MAHDGMIVRGQFRTHAQLKKWWQCRCGSRLVLQFRDGWVTECAINPEHDPDGWFITQSIVQEEQGRMMVYQEWYDRTGGKDRMAFVKDRHDTDGKLTDRPRVRRAGRISLGEQREQGGAMALPHFRFVPYEEELASEALMNQVFDAIEKYAPQKNVEEPTVLPVFLAADNLEIVAGSTYKLAGKDGHARCVGDGETIQWKLGPRNLIEISQGEVVIKKLVVDGKGFTQGETVYCPGRSDIDRWEHCEKCRLQLTIDFQIAGLPYIWSLATGDKQFYDQFFTVIEMMDGYIKQGIVRFLPEIPLLLRREEAMRARPNKTNAGTTLTWQEMPTMSIEVHPIWKMMIASKQGAMLAPGEMPTQIEAPKAWHERAMQGRPERPWEPEDVGAFVTRAMQEYTYENENATEIAPASTIKITRDQLAHIFAKTMGEDDTDKAVDVVFWYLFGGEVKTYAQCAAVYRWARENVVVDGKEGTAQVPEFEQEVLTTLSAAAAMAADFDEEETEEEPF